MQVLKRASCGCCGRTLSKDNALRCEDKLICNDMECMKLCISESDYNCLCREFTEDICSEQFHDWLAENYFCKAKDEDIEYFEED